MQNFKTSYFKDEQEFSISTLKIIFLQYEGSTLALDTLSYTFIDIHKTQVLLPPTFKFQSLKTSAAVDCDFVTDMPGLAVTL